MAIGDGYKTNFETLQKASDNGDLVLMECRERATGQVCVLVCALGREGEEVTFAPLARMIDGNPYELYDPPDPDNPEGFINN